MEEAMAIADQIERRRVVDLVPYARNARTHSEDQIGQIVRSSEEFGWTMPVLVGEDGIIIAGHGRVLAAERLGIGEVPVIVGRGWTPEQVEAYRIADNKIATNAGWDEALMSLAVADLDDLGFDITKLGLSAAEAKAFRGEDEENGERKVNVREVEIATGPVKDEFWIVIKGPLAQQADALQRFETVMKELEGVRVEMGTTVLE
jgi:ParB-like chromosome segregation protein Spo0J